MWRGEKTCKKKLRRRVQNYNKRFQIQWPHPKRGLWTQGLSFFAFDRFVFSRQPLVSLIYMELDVVRVWGKSGKRLILVPPLIPPFYAIIHLLYSCNRLPSFLQVLGIGSSPWSPRCSAPNSLLIVAQIKNAEIRKKLSTSWCPVAVQFQHFRDGELSPWHEGQSRTMSEKLRGKHKAGARQFKKF